MAKFKLSLLTIITDGVTENTRCLQSTISEFDSEIKGNTRPDSYSKNTENNFCYSYNENLKLKINNQKELTFSMNKMTIHNDSWEENPFVQNIHVGSQLALTDKYNNTMLFSVKSISYTFKEQNTVFQYNCQDSFSFQLSRQNDGYTIENDASSDDFIGAKPVDWWVNNKIVPECYISYTYLGMNQGLYMGFDNRLHIYYANQRVYNIQKIIKHPQTATEYHEPITFSGSGTANSLLISLGEQLGLSLNTCEAIGDNGILLKYFWFEPSKNEQPSGLYFSPYKEVKNFSLQHTGNTLTTVLNVSGGEIDGELVTLLPQASPFFTKYFQSEDWRGLDYTPGVFTRICQGEETQLTKLENNFLNLSVKSLIPANTAKLSTISGSWGSANGETWEDRKLSILHKNLEKTGTKPSVCVLPVFKNPKSDKFISAANSSVVDVYIPLVNGSFKTIPGDDKEFNTYKLSSFYSKFQFNNTSGSSYVLATKTDNSTLLISPTSYNWQLSLLEPEIQQDYYITPPLTTTQIEQQKTSTNPSTYYPYISLGYSPIDKHNDSCSIFGTADRICLKKTEAWTNDIWIKIKIWFFKDESYRSGAYSIATADKTAEIKITGSTAEGTLYDIEKNITTAPGFSDYYKCCAEFSSNKPDALEHLILEQTFYDGTIDQFLLTKDSYYQLTNVQDSFVWVTGQNRNELKPASHLTPILLQPDRFATIDEIINNDWGVATPVRMPGLLENGDSITSSNTINLYGLKYSFSNLGVPSSTWEKITQTTITEDYRNLFITTPALYAPTITHNRSDICAKILKEIVHVRSSTWPIIGTRPTKIEVATDYEGRSLIEIYTKESNQFSLADSHFVSGGTTINNISSPSAATEWCIVIWDSEHTSYTRNIKSRLKIYSQNNSISLDNLHFDSLGSTSNSIIQSNSRFVLDTTKCTQEDEVQGVVKLLDETAQVLGPSKVTYSVNSSTAGVNVSGVETLFCVLTTKNSKLNLKEMFSFQSPFGVNKKEFDVWSLIKPLLQEVDVFNNNVICSYNQAIANDYQLHKALNRIPTEGPHLTRANTRDLDKANISIRLVRMSGSTSFLSTYHTKGGVQIVGLDDKATDPIIFSNIMLTLAPGVSLDQAKTYVNFTNDNIWSNLKKIPGTNTYTFNPLSIDEIYCGTVVTDNHYIIPPRRYDSFINFASSRNILLLQDNIVFYIKGSTKVKYTWVVYDEDKQVIDCGSTYTKKWLETKHTVKLNESNNYAEGSGVNYQAIYVDEILKQTGGKYCSIVFQYNDSLQTRPYLWNHNIIVKHNNKIIPVLCLPKIGREPDVLYGEQRKVYAHTETTINQGEEISQNTLNQPQLTYIKIRMNKTLANNLKTLTDYAFYLKWSRDVTDEDVLFATIADQCPWLENRLVDFKYFYERNIITKKEFESLSNLFNNTLRIINGQLLAASQQYYAALHNKTQTLSNLTNNLDLLGANFASEVLVPYKQGESVFDTTQFKQSYKNLFPTTPYGYLLLDYDATISDYVNKYFNAEQRFLKNIYNFKKYFEEPVSFYPKGGGLFQNILTLDNSEYTSADSGDIIQISFPSANMVKLDSSYSNYISSASDYRWGYCFDNIYKKTESGYQTINPVDAYYFKEHKENIKKLQLYDSSAGMRLCSTTDFYNPTATYYRKDWKLVGDAVLQNQLFEANTTLTDENANIWKPYKTQQGLYFKQEGILTPNTNSTDILLGGPHGSYQVEAVFVEVSKNEIKRNFLANVLKNNNKKQSNGLWYWKDENAYVPVLSGTNRWMRPDELSVALTTYFTSKTFLKNPRIAEYSSSTRDKLYSTEDGAFSGDNARDLYIRFFPIQELYFYDHVISFIDNIPTAINKAGKTYKQWRELYENDLSTIEEQPYNYKTYQRVGFVNEDSYKQYFWRCYITSSTSTTVQYDVTALKAYAPSLPTEDADKAISTYSNLLTLVNEVYQYEDSCFGNTGTPSTTLSGLTVYSWNTIGQKEGVLGTDDDYNIKKQIFAQTTAGYRLYAVYINTFVDGIHYNVASYDSATDKTTYSSSLSTKNVHYYNYAGNLLHTYHSICKNAGSTIVQPYSSFVDVRDQYYYRGKWYRPKKLTDFINRNEKYKILIQPEKFININNINNETTEAGIPLKFSPENLINAIQFYPIEWVLMPCDLSDIEWGNAKTLTLMEALIKAGFACQAVSDDSYKIQLSGGASTSTHINQVYAYIYHEENYNARDFLTTYNTNTSDWFNQLATDNYTIYDSNSDLEVDYSKEAYFLEGYYLNLDGTSSLVDVTEFNIDEEYYEYRNGSYEPIYTIKQLQNMEDVYYLSNTQVVNETLDAQSEWLQNVNVIHLTSKIKNQIYFTDPAGTTRPWKIYDIVDVSYIENETVYESKWRIISITQTEIYGSKTYTLEWESGANITSTGFALTIDGASISTYQTKTATILSTEDYMSQSQLISFKYNNNSSETATITYQDQTYSFPYTWSRVQLCNFDLMSNGMFWLNFHNRLDYTTLFQQAALIEMKLTEYWSQAYNASQFCQYFLPETWQPTQNNEANIFSGDILKITNNASTINLVNWSYTGNSGSLEKTTENLSGVSLGSVYIPEVTIVNNGSPQMDRYTLRYYTDQQKQLDSTLTSNLLERELSEGVFYNLSVCAAQNGALQDLITTLDLNPNQWQAVKSGKQTYYRYKSGGTTWKQLASKILNETLEYFGGWYQLAVYALSYPFYRPQNVTQYETLQYQHNQIWKQIYQTYPHIVLEKNYTNTTALDSESLLKVAKYAFNDFKEVEKQYSITLIDINSIKGYTGQELRIGDSIALRYPDYYDDVGEIQDSLKQLLFITDISYNLRQDTDVAVTVNTIKYQDKLIQRLAKLIR